MAELRGREDRTLSSQNVRTALLPDPAAAVASGKPHRQTRGGIGDTQAYGEIAV